MGRAGAPELMRAYRLRFSSILSMFRGLFPRSLCEDEPAEGGIAPESRWNIKHHPMLVPCVCMFCMHAIWGLKVRK